MPYQFPEVEFSSGWVSMRDLQKMGVTFVVSQGFLEDDPNNTFQGQPAPRFVVKGAVQPDGDEIRVSVRQGYSRDEKLTDLAAWLDANPGETVTLKVVKPGSSAYLDFEVVA